MSTKSIFLYFLAVIFIAGCTVESKNIADNKYSIRISGSESILPLAKQEVLEFCSSYKNYEFEVEGGGSETGMEELKYGKTDLAMSSRELKLGEKLFFQQSNRMCVEKIIGFDALAIIVNKENKVHSLTREQLADIYEGKIKNWKELGGDDLPIHAYIRDINSGTYRFFNEQILENQKLSSATIVVSSNDELIEKVKSDKSSIGYVSLGKAGDEVSPVSLSFDKGETYIYPSRNNVQNLSYPIIRPLYFYYPFSKQEYVKDFVDYVLSSKGQQILTNMNYVPVSNYSITAYKVLPPM